MFDWYTTMNQPDWDGRTYALPLPSMMPPSQHNPMQRPQATNEMLPQGSVSGGLLGKLAEEGEQATPRMPSPFGPRQGQGGAAASPAPVQRPAPQANSLTAPASGPLAGPVMQPQMMPQQSMPMAAPYGWGQPLPQMAGQGTASAQTGKAGEDKGFLGNMDPGALALFAGLSMLGNNTGGRTFGQLVGKAGFDALAGAGGMAAAQAAAERQKKQDAREDMATRMAQHKIDLERYKMAQEVAGMQALQGYLGGGSGGGRPTLGGQWGGQYTGAALAPEVDGWIVKYSQEYGVDPNIVRAVVMQESGGRQDVISPAGAIGYGQLMLDTAKGLGVDPYDPEQNIKGTVMYLGQMRDRYDGNWDRALYAYNWGPGNMDAYLQTGKGLDGRPMPSETLNYVPGVRGRLSGGQQPAVAGGYGGGAGGMPMIPLQALTLPGAAGEAARAVFAAQQKVMDRLQYVDGVGMIDKSTGMVAPLRTADGMPYMSPKQRKEEADASKQEQAREAQRRFALQNAKTQMTSLGNALSMIPEPGRGVSWDTGFTGSVLSMLPGTDARNLQAELDTIGSGSMLQTMQALKAASPTGATGMGALSDSEGKLLRESLGSLDTWQSPEQLRRNLLNIKAVYTDMLVSWGYTPEQAASLFVQPKRGKAGAANEGETIPPMPSGAYPVNF